LPSITSPIAEVPEVALALLGEAGKGFLSLSPADRYNSPRCCTGVAVRTWRPGIWLRLSRSCRRHWRPRNGQFDKAEILDALGQAVDDVQSARDFYNRAIKAYMKGVFVTPADATRQRLDALPELTDNRPQLRSDR